MKFVHLHPTGMVWPLSVRGLRVAESVRGDGGVLRNSEGKRYMFNYVPDVFRAQYAETEEEAYHWYVTGEIEVDLGTRPLGAQAFHGRRGVRLHARVQPAATPA